MLNSSLQGIVEQLCHDGCSAVNGYIEKLEQGESLRETEQLSDSERDQILAELKSIMSVYKRDED